MTFGEKVKNCREKLGFTQTELASKAHISQAYLSQLENNVFNPTAPMIVNIASAVMERVFPLLTEPSQITAS